MIVYGWRINQDQVTIPVEIGNITVIRLPTRPRQDGQKSYSVVIAFGLEHPARLDVAGKGEMEIESLSAKNFEVRNGDHLAPSYDLAGERSSEKQTVWRANQPNEDKRRTGGRILKMIADIVQRELAKRAAQVEAVSAGVVTAVGEVR